MYKLVVLDIDGTLLNSNKEITKKTSEYIKKASEMGVRFIIASGRTPYGILPIAKEIELEKIGGYILAYNGGACLNCENMDLLYENFIDKSEMESIYNFANENNIPILTYNKDVMYTANETTKYLELEANINNLKIYKAENFVEEVDFDFPKVILTDDGDKLAKYVEKAEKTFNNLEVFRSEPFFLEICPKGIHKATGIAKIIEILGVKREEVIAIGDGFNDVTMIEYAGLGVAMDNAHDDVKAIADYVTLSNDEDGVCKVIEEFIFNKK